MARPTSARRIRAGFALTMSAALLSALLVLSVSSSQLPVAHAARDLADSSACESCLVAAHVLYDAIGDPYVETKLAEFLIGSICPNFDDKKSCEENVNNLVEALVEWMRVNLEPDALCASAGVCASPSSAPPPYSLAHLLRGLAPSPQNNNGPKDVTCPLCMFVITKIKDALSDPITREKVHDAGIKACAALPEGAGVRDACVDFVEKNESQIFDFVDQTEPAQLCEKLAACPPPGPPPPLEMAVPEFVVQALALLQMAGLNNRELPALPPRSAALASLAPIVSSLSLAPPTTPTGSLRDAQANCDACMAVVKDVHAAIASPDLQDQIAAAAKQACDALGGADLTKRCKEGVDQYAPLVFGMALAYLQPANLCAQMHICPPPPSLVGFEKNMKEEEEAGGMTTMIGDEEQLILVADDEPQAGATRAGQALGGWRALEPLVLRDVSKGLGKGGLPQRLHHQLQQEQVQQRQQEQQQEQQQQEQEVLVAAS